MWSSVTCDTRTNVSVLRVLVVVVWIRVCLQSAAVVMISVELWRARIGTFNNKCCSDCSLSSSSLVSSHCHRHTHHGGGSTDVSREEPSSTAHTSPYSNTLATKEQSQEFSSTDHHSTSSSTCTSQPRTAQLTLSCSYGSSFIASSFSSTSKFSSSSSPSSRDLCRSLLRDAVVTLLIAIISQLLTMAGDIETNPGPKHGGENEPTCCNYASVGGAPEAYGSRRVCVCVCVCVSVCLYVFRARFSATAKN